MAEFNIETASRSELIGRYWSAIEDLEREFGERNRFESDEREWSESLDELGPRALPVSAGARDLDMRRPIIDRRIEIARERCHALRLAIQTLGRPLETAEG